MIKLFKTNFIYAIGPFSGFAIFGSLFTGHIIYAICITIFVIFSFKYYFKWNANYFKQQELDRTRYILNKTKNCTFIKSYNTEDGEIKVYRNKKTGKLIEL